MTLWEQRVPYPSKWGKKMKKNIKNSLRIGSPLIFFRKSPLGGSALRYNIYILLHSATLQPLHLLYIAQFSHNTGV